MNGNMRIERNFSAQEKLSDLVFPGSHQSYLSPLSLPPCFSWVEERPKRENRFNGLSRAAETVETVPAFADSTITQLKQGVNERGHGWCWWDYNFTWTAAT